MEDEGQESLPTSPTPTPRAVAAGPACPLAELGMDKLAQCPASFSHGGSTPDVSAQCSAAPSFPNQHRRVYRGVFSLTWTASFMHSCGRGH